MNKPADRLKPRMKPSRRLLAVVANEHTTGLLSHQQAIAQLQSRCEALEQLQRQGIYDVSRDRYVSLASMWATADKAYRTLARGFWGRLRWLVTGR